MMPSASNTFMYFVLIMCNLADTLPNLSEKNKLCTLIMVFTVGDRQILHASVLSISNSHMSIANRHSSCLLI